MKMLPTCLTDFELFQALEESERRGFEGKLRYCEEISITAKSISLIDVDRLLESIDSLQLDVYSAMGATPTLDGVSAYRIHTGWGVLLSSSELQGYVGPEFYELMSFVAVPNCDAAASVNWIRNWGGQIDECLNAFFVAKDYSAAFARLLLLDALLTAFLTFCVLFRVNVANSPS